MDELRDLSVLPRLTKWCASCWESWLTRRDWVVGVETMDGEAEVSMLRERTRGWESMLLISFL